MLTEHTAAILGFMRIVVENAYEERAMLGALPNEVRDTAEDLELLYRWTWTNPKHLDDVFVRESLKHMGRLYLKPFSSRPVDVGNW